MSKVKYLFRKNYANVITISIFFFWGKSAFFCNNMVAMVSIETPGFRSKRWLTLDKNFFFSFYNVTEPWQRSNICLGKTTQMSSRSQNFFLRYKCFFCNNMVAMVTIETPGFRPKRWWTLDKNFLFPSTMSLNHGKDQIFV